MYYSVFLSSQNTRNMKIGKWIQQYFDYLYDVTPGKNFREEQAEGMVKAMPLFIAISFRRIMSSIF